MHDTKLISSVSNEETGLIWGAASTEAVCGDLKSCNQGEPDASNPFCIFLARQTCEMGMCLCQLSCSKPTSSEPGCFGAGWVRSHVPRPEQHWTQKTASCLSFCYRRLGAMLGHTCLPALEFSTNVTARPFAVLLCSSATTVVLE